MPQVDPNPRQLNSLATKIILMVFASTFTTAVVVSWVSIQSEYASLSRSVERIHPTAAQHAADQARAWVEQARSELAARLEADGGTGDLPADGGSRLEEIFRCESGALPESGGPCRPELTRGLTAVEVEGRRVAAIVAELPSGDGHAVGILHWGRLASLLYDSHPSEEGRSFVIDPAGRVLPPEVDLAASVISSLTSSAARREIHEYTTAAGRHVIASAAPIDPEGWLLAYETPFEVAFAPVLSVITRVFLIDLAVILIASWLAYHATSTVLRPIEKLSEGARRVAEGQFDLELPELETGDEIGVLTRAFNDMLRKIRSYQADVEARTTNLMSRNSDLEQANEVLEQLSITDGLTKLHNHRFFQDHLTREIKRVSRVSESLSLLLIDIDDFKSLNDRLGHAAGDELLRRLARVMNDKVRETDLLARYGGEEFAVLAPNTDQEGAYQLAEKLRIGVAESSFILDESLRPTRVTVSIGLAEYAGNRKRFFDEADRALYRAKASGKNCVMIGAEGEA